MAEFNFDNLAALAPRTGEAKRAEQAAQKLTDVEKMRNANQQISARLQIERGVKEAELQKQQQAREKMAKISNALNSIGNMANIFSGATPYKQPDTVEQVEELNAKERGEMRQLYEMEEAKAMRQSSMDLSYAARKEAMQREDAQIARNEQQRKEAAARDAQMNAEKNAMIKQQIEREAKQWEADYKLKKSQADANTKQTNTRTEMLKMEASNARSASEKMMAIPTKDGQSRRIPKSLYDENLHVVKALVAEDARSGKIPSLRGLASVPNWSIADSDLPMYLHQSPRAMRALGLGDSEQEPDLINNIIQGEQRDVPAWAEISRKDSSGYLIQQESVRNNRLPSHNPKAYANTK